MPDLHFNLQAGPRFNWQLYKTEQSTWTIRLPWRGAMDIKGDYLGWVSEPDLNAAFMPADDLTIRLGAVALFAFQKHNATDYSVDTLYANASRPAYAAKGGLHSLSECLRQLGDHGSPACIHCSALSESQSRCCLKQPVGENTT